MSNEGVLRGLSLAMTIQNATGSSGGGGRGIVRDSLRVWYDGIDNTVYGHSSNTAEWWDLSGHGNTGAIRNGTWGDDELICNGSSTWVNCGRQDFKAVTIEILVTIDRLVYTTWPVIAANFQNGGYGFNQTNSTNFVTQVWKGGAYRQLYVGPQEVGVYNLLGLSADSHMQRVFLNGQFVAETIYDAPISLPSNGTVFGLGGNSDGSSPSGDYFNGRIKSFRLYDRVLTDEEIAQNYNYDKRRFGL